MATFYKAVVHHTLNQQEVLNVLYYRPPVPDTASWSADVATQLGQAVEAAWRTTMLPRFSSLVALRRVEMSAVNERNEVISPYTIAVPATGTGAQIGATNGPGPVMIVAFQTVATTLVNMPRVPKRSYVALPWVVDTQIANDGTVVTVANDLTALNAVLTQGHLVNAVQFSPVRIGRPNHQDIPAVGDVQGIIIRPYASFRRSRMNPPSGEAA
mgnify:CR=1 FL=1